MHVSIRVDIKGHVHLDSLAPRLAIYPAHVLAFVCLPVQGKLAPRVQTIRNALSVIAAARNAVAIVQPMEFVQPD
jgi:hypothetical protein